MQKLIVCQIHDAEDAPEDESTDSFSDGEVSNEDFAYILGAKTPITASSHPPAEHIRQLWQIFVENVDPLTKLVHVPSLQPAIEKAISNMNRIPRGFEALMFAIYNMAVLSSTADECHEYFGVPRTMLLNRYVGATKTALSRANFMSSTSIVVLQALVLHILSIRDSYEPRAVWSLTGVAIRIAEGMGMRLDGELLGLPPFQTEIHRRIWWQLRMHNFRAAELCGQAKFRDFDIDETTPKKPANVNDADIYPTMQKAPVESNRPTEMIWIMFRADLATFAASQKVKMQKSGKAMATSEEYVAMDDLKIKDGFIKSIEDMLETKYLRFCDPTQPLQFLTLLGIRLSTNLIRFLAHHPRRWSKLDHVPTSEQQFVWNTVIQLLEQYSMMQSSPQLRCFVWSVPYFIQWHAVIHVLDTVRADPLRLDAPKAWRLIDTLYEYNSGMLLGIKRPIFVAVGNLCLKAFSARVAALTKEKRSLPNTPRYIDQLREQREAAKVRRQAANARSKEGKTVKDEKRSLTMNANSKSSDLDPDTRPADPILEPEPQKHLVAEQSGNPLHGSTRTGDDAFWLNDTLGEDFFTGGAVDVMNLDTDAILAQASWLDTPNDEAINWAQWDAWLGDLDAVRPNVGTGT